MFWLAFILLGAGIAWLTVQFITAPIGYETDEGFFLGEPPDDVGCERPDALASRQSLSFHDNSNSREGKHNHA